MRWHLNLLSVILQYVPDYEFQTKMVVLNKRIKRMILTPEPWDIFKRIPRFYHHFFTRHNVKA